MPDLRAGQRAPARSAAKAACDLDAKGGNWKEHSAALAPETRRWLRRWMWGWQVALRHPPSCRSDIWRGTRRRPPGSGSHTMDKANRSLRIKNLRWTNHWTGRCRVGLKGTNVRFGSRAASSIPGRVVWRRHVCIQPRAGINRKSLPYRGAPTRKCEPRQAGWIGDARFSSSTLAAILQDDNRLAAVVSRAAPCRNQPSTPAIRHSRLSAWIWIHETPEAKE